MVTIDLRIELPATLSQEEAKLLLAIKLFEVGKATLGQAAKLAELSKPAFIEILSRHGVPVFNYSPEELGTEIDGMEVFDEATQRQREKASGISEGQGFLRLAGAVNGPEDLSRRKGFSRS